jgi:hypothetical protein
MVCARFFLALSGLDAAALSAAWAVRGKMTIASIIERHVDGMRRYGFILKTTDIPQMFSTILDGTVLQYRRFSWSLFPVNNPHS